MRTTPYKDVTRAKCARCGERAEYQWEGPCAMITKQGKPRYVPLCGDCDKQLNLRTMQFVFGVGRAIQMMKGYL